MVINKNQKRLGKDLEEEFFLKNKIMFALNMILRLSIGLVEIVLSYSLMNIIDTAVAGEWNRFYKTIFICVGAIVLDAVCFFVMRYTYAAFLRKGVMQYRNAVFKKILKRSLSQRKQDLSAVYLSALTNDITTMETGYYEKLFLAVTSVVMCVISLCLMLHESWLLTLIVVAFMLIPISVSIVTGNRLAQTEKIVSDKNADFVAVLRDFFDGFSIIKLFQIEKQTEQIFDRYNKDLEDVKYRKRTLSRLIEMLSGVAGEVSQFGMMIVGGILVLNKTGVTIGMITMFLQLMNYLLAPLNDIPQIIAAKKSKHLLIEKIAGLLSVEEKEQNTQIVEKLENGIYLRNVSYSYEGENPVLNDVSVDFERGKSYAIIGPSGCGKSTLLNLVAGNLTNYDGQILFDSVDVRDCSVASLYQHIVFMQQQVFLFRDTLRNNITLYRDITEEKIDEVIKKAGLDTLIQTVGLDYTYGESVNNLSGGEKQRIAIARGLLMDGEVLVMDEMTSALDMENSRKIISEVLSLKDKTKIMVTHNLDEEILRKVDKIIVMSEGRIVEKGDYETLVQKGNIMWV